MGCNLADVTSSFSGDFNKFRVGHEIYMEMHPKEEEDLRLGDSAFVGYEKNYESMFEEETVRKLMEEHSAGDDGTISWSVNGKGSLTAKIKSLKLMDDGKWRLATDKGVAVFREGEVQSEPKDGKFVVVPAMMFTNPVNRELSFENRELQDGDPISVYRQVEMGDGSHVTLNFNPEGKYSLGPQTELVDGTKVKVVKIGEFESDSMRYDVVKVVADGKEYYSQNDGTPYHITRYVNSEKGIKPFMTGKHAKTGAYTRVEDTELGKGTVGTFKGTYKTTFDRSGDILKEGTTFAHVSSYEGISFAASAGDIVDGEPASWLGMHIGTAQVVKDYENQTFKNDKEMFVYEVRLKRDLNSLMLPDPGVDWTADSMYEGLVAAHPEVEWSKDMSNEEVKQKILELGYDSIAYANTQEGRKSGKADSVIMLDGSAVEVSKPSGNVKDVFDEYMDMMKVVQGNTNKAADANWRGLKEQVEYVHGSKESMFAMFEKIRELSVNKASDKVHEELKGLLGKMKPEFFENVTLYLKQTNKESAGRMKGKNIEIAVSKNVAEINNGQTDEEIYVHEVLHAMIAFALRSGHPEATKAKREIRFLMDKTRKETDWKMFLNKGEESVNEELEEIRAKETWDYVFNSDNALDEFIVHVMTNPAMKAKAEKIKVGDTTPKNQTLLEKIVSMFNTLFDVVLGNYSFADKSKNVQEAVEELAFKLADINTRASRETQEKENMGVRFNEAINELDDTLYRKMHKFWMDNFEDNEPIKELEKDAGTLEKAAYFTKFVGKAMTNKHYAEAMGLIASSWGLDPTSSLRGWVRDFKESGAVTQTVEWLSMASSKIDGARMSAITAAKKNVLDGFKDKLKLDEEKALTRVVIDTDLAEMIKDTSWDNKSIRELLTDDAKLETEIGRAKAVLEKLDKDRAMWNTNQASGLGYYMATGKAGIAQNMNADNIAIGYMSSQYKKKDKNVVNAINTVATLVALKHTDKKQKLVVAELMKKDHKGVWNLMHLYNGAKKQSDELLFEKGTHRVKGYSKEVFDEGIVTKIAPINQKDELEKAGYRLVNKLTGHQAVKMDKDMGLFVSDSFVQNEWLMAGTRLTSFGRKGTTITEQKYAEGSKFAGQEADISIQKMHGERRKIAKAMEEGNYDYEKDFIGMMPVLDEHGSVVDYRYVMDKESKERLLKQDIRVGEVMGRTFGSILDKDQSAKHNEKVLKLILDEMEANWTSGMLGKNDTLQEWTQIGPNVADKEMRELYSLLPKEFQMAAQAREDKVLAVPTELLHLYFGYRHMSIANANIVKDILPKYMTHLVRLAEAIWQEIGKGYKAAVLLKTPIVLIQNIVSNFMYAINTGSNPLELIKMYFESFKDTRRYITKHRELNDLKMKYHATTDKGEQLKLDRQAKAITDELKDNPIHELYELGMYTAIVEDVERADLKGGKMKKFFDKRLEGMWEPAKVGLQWMYLSEETGWYKMNQEILTMSDLIARDVQNRKVKVLEQRQVNGEVKLPVWYLDKHPGNEKRKLVGEERKEFLKEARVYRHYGLLEDYINYNKPSGKGESYLERMSIINFTKYTKRIQRIISKTATHNPVRTFLTLLVDGMMGGVSTIQDASFAAKHWYTHGFGGGNIVPLYTPLDIVLDEMHPHLISLVNGEGFGHKWL